MLVHRAKAMEAFHELLSDADTGCRGPMRACGAVCCEEPPATWYCGLLTRDHKEGDHVALGFQTPLLRLRKLGLAGAGADRPWRFGKPWPLART
ncbi:hypothetical protein [Mumia zhuanghuii]|uniref:Uncharacterized protein n=1 Tax=Mumia zhuanghuii TaxID=2585211 RepID=A0A5C4MBZ5_9ACTN|nr:hypothetical protein [Mumia zhuanghuii]TNC35593.1 hypothetical protein FHE65_26970 [Mumia zhuanghuii]